MADDSKDPLRQLVDVMVYAPIGLLTLAQQELPNLISTGKTRFDNQIMLARFMGQMAVKQGRRELERRLDAAATARQQAAQPVIDVTAAAEPVADPQSLPEALIEAVASTPIIADLDADLDGVEVEAPAALPIEGYDSLAASQVVMRLVSLTPGELELVRLHEDSHRARRTILGKISQLQAQ